MITTGGTGRDGTPEAILPLLDKEPDGFGEVFRLISYQDIKSSTLQARALAGDVYILRAGFVRCLPHGLGFVDQRSGPQDAVNLKEPHPTNPSFAGAMAESSRS